MLQMTEVLGSRIILLHALIFKATSIFTTMAKVSLAMERHSTFISRIRMAIREKSISKEHLEHAIESLLKLLETTESEVVDCLLSSEKMDNMDSCKGMAKWERASVEQIFEIKILIERATIRFSACRASTLLGQSDNYLCIIKKQMREKSLTAIHAKRCIVNLRDLIENLKIQDGPAESSKKTATNDQVAELLLFLKATKSVFGSLGKAARWKGLPERHFESWDRGRLTSRKAEDFIQKLSECLAGKASEDFAENPVTPAQIQAYLMKLESSGKLEKPIEFELGPEEPDEDSVFDNGAFHQAVSVIDWIRSCPMESGVDLSISEDGVRLQIDGHEVPERIIKQMERG